MTVCIIDTTVFCNILGIPNMSSASEHNQDIAIMGEYIQAQFVFLLPWAVILETGNHIGQNGDGNVRRQKALILVDYVTAALRRSVRQDGEVPRIPISLMPTPMPDSKTVAEWLHEFPDCAMRSVRSKLDERKRGHGFGDLSIIKDYERTCRQFPQRRVFIWSHDEHLICHDRTT